MLKQFSLCVVLGVALTGSALHADSNARPNILFIFADDLGWGDIGAYGNRNIQTPNMDRLAKEGRLFTNGYVSGSVCSPSRAAVLTGLYPSRTGTHAHFANSQYNAQRGIPDALPLAYPTFPQALQEAGYHTAHFGKWHLGDLDASLYGFDLARTANGGGKDAYLLPEGYMQFFSKSAETFTNDAIAFLDKASNHPFYIQVWYLEPHAPNFPKEEFLNLYQKPAGVPEEWIIPDALIAYQAVVSELDQQIGRLLDALDENGLSENTLVILSSDNGPEDYHIRNRANTLGMGSPGPFRGRKRSLYEGGVRVPFIVRWPGTVPAGTVDNESVVGCIDLFPTFTALAGVSPTMLSAHDGVDILPAIRGEPFERKKPLFWEWRYGVSGFKFNVSPTHAMRLGMWKYLMNHDGTRKELYNLKEDPVEVDNLASEHPEIVESMEASIQAWRQTIPKWENASQSVGSNAYPWPSQKP